MRTHGLRALSMTSKISTTGNSSPSSGAYTAEEYTRNPNHKARTAHANESSYILTLHTEVSHHKTMTALRDAHFPPKINKLAAHVALFRALPGSELSRITADISALVATRKPFEVSAGNPFRLRQGVGISVHADEAKDIYDELSKSWEEFLSNQDRSFRAHYTIQNKVEDENVVKKTLEEVKENFQGSKGMVLGLGLYEYDRGYWKKERDFMFP